MGRIERASQRKATIKGLSLQSVLALCISAACLIHLLVSMHSASSRHSPRSNAGSLLQEVEEKYVKIRATHNQFDTELNRQVKRVDERLLGRGTVLPAADQLGDAERMSRKAASASSASSSARQSVVMGLVAGNKGYRRNSYAFLRSLRRSGYAGDVVLGVSADEPITSLEKDIFGRLGATLRTVETFRCKPAHGVPEMMCMRFWLAAGPSKGLSGSAKTTSRIVGFGSNPPDVATLQRLGVAASATTKSVNVSLELGRFELYRDWLTAGKYASNDLVFVSDVRDVYFQRPPFDDLEPFLARGHDLFLFREQRRNVIRWSSPKQWNFNQGWIWACWGKPAVESISEDSPVHCSGTTMGTVGGMRRYLDAMLAEVIPRVQMDTARGPDTCPGWLNPTCDCTGKGIDQGFHNYLASARVRVPVDAGPAAAAASLMPRSFESPAFGKYLSFAQGNGPVNTLGYVCDGGLGPEGPKPEWGDSKLRFDKNGLVLEEKGDGKVAAGTTSSSLPIVSAVVHQFDRCTGSERPPALGRLTAPCDDNTCKHSTSRSLLQFAAV